jgi:transcription-repair coupling factor (superfamily II helicase)
MMDRFGQLPPPAIALVELRRLRLLGAQGAVESLRVFQDVAEMLLRRPLKPDEIRTMMGVLDRGVQVEFVTGKEFALRVRGQGVALLHRARQVLDALALALAPPSAAGAGAPGAPKA